MLNGPFIERYFSEMRQIVDTISREDIDRAIEALFAAWREYIAWWMVKHLSP